MASGPWGLKWLTKMAKGRACPWRLAPQIIFQWPMAHTNHLFASIRHVCLLNCDRAQTSPSLLAATIKSHGAWQCSGCGFGE